MSARELADAVGIGYGLYLKYEAMTIKPFGAQGLKPSARAICDFHGLGADELFPESLKLIDQHVVEKRLDAHEVECLESRASHILSLPEEAVVECEKRRAVDRAVSSLPPRQEDVIREHFGLDDRVPDKTLKEVSEKVECLRGGHSRERMRQRIAQGLRMLRHPDRSRALRPFVD